MAKKSTTASEPVASGGLAPARARKHAPAKRTAKPVAESSSSAGAGDVVTGDPPYQEIARLAYSYWEARGRQGGSPEEDWQRAEQELRSGLVSTAKA